MLFIPGERRNKLSAFTASDFMAEILFDFSPSLS